MFLDQFRRKIARNTDVTAARLRRVRGSDMEILRRRRSGSHIRRKQRIQESKKKNRGEVRGEEDTRGVPWYVWVSSAMNLRVLI